MATTNLVVDYLIIGVSSFAWMLPALFILLGEQWLSKITSPGIATAFAMLGIVYILGICMSRFADDLMDRKNDRMRDEVFENDKNTTYHSMLNLIILRSESAADYLSYRRSIVRITRACAVNFLLGIVAWPAWYLYERYLGLAPSSVLTLLVCLGCLLLFLLLYKAWPVVLKGYFYSIRDMYEYLRQDSASRGQVSMESEKAQGGESLPALTAES